MLQVMIGPRLERVRQQQQLRLAEQLARQLQAGRGSPKKPLGRLIDRMAGAIGEQQVAPMNRSSPAIAASICSMTRMR